MISACYDHHAAWDFHQGLDQFQETGFDPFNYFSNYTSVLPGINRVFDYVDATPDEI